MWETHDPREGAHAIEDAVPGATPVTAARCGRWLVPALRARELEIRYRSTDPRDGRVEVVAH